ncbi:cysteine protease, partial [Ascosphaera acerosa]
FERPGLCRPCFPDIVADSGDYRRGCALAEHVDVPRGTFTLICSTFREDQLGRFTLWVHSSAPCAVRPLPAESAGRLRIAAGTAVLAPGVDRVLAPLAVDRLTRLTVVAKRVAGVAAHPPSPLLMSIEQGQCPFGETLAFSGDGSFDDAAPSVRIEDVDLSPDMARQGGLWLAIERPLDTSSSCYGGVETRVEVELLADERAEVGGWRPAPDYSS